MRYFKDLFLTDSHLIRGHVSTGSWRLTTFLNTTDRAFVEVGTPTFIGCADGARTSSDRAFVNLREILLALELDDADGDEVLKGLTERGRSLTAVKIRIGGPAPLVIRGDLDSRTAERTDLGPNDFIVIKGPEIIGLPPPILAEQAFPAAPSYVIVNRRRIAFMFT